MDPEMPDLNHQIANTMDEKQSHVNETNTMNFS